MDAEKAVLGSILLLPQVFDEVALIIRPKSTMTPIGVSSSISCKCTMAGSKSIPCCWSNAFAWPINLKRSAGQPISPKWPGRYPPQPMPNTTPVLLPTKRCSARSSMSAPTSFTTRTTRLPRRARCSARRKRAFLVFSNLAAAAN
ncbi:MAG: hypothetical protein GXP28_09555 [Planctomycetes bacterium]|nr:hypothetical protein [Planctomycetota bacterium]